MQISFDKLTKSYNGKTVLENITGALHQADRVGLIGANGVGKTTLIKLLTGLEEADGGKIAYTPNSLKILYIEQRPEFKDDVTVWEQVYGTVSLRRSINTEVIVKKALNQVGLAEELWSQKARNLSGGEKTKLMLSQILVSDYDVLFLDEPTNHLDMESCRWLETQLSQLGQPLIVVSHDRYFLDKVTNKIWELTPKGLKTYSGNYSAYKVQKEQEEKNLTKEYAKQQARIESLEAMIAARRSWYASAHKAAGQNDFWRSKAKKHASALKAKEKELERLKNNPVSKPPKTISPAFEIINKGVIDKKLPPIIVEVQDLTKSYDSKLIFKNVSFTVKRGEKIALLGSNGTGKTTLLKIITGLEEASSGLVRLSPSVTIGYFAQELNNLNRTVTILDEVLSCGAAMDEARLLLACLLFRGDAVYKRIGNLSMGEQGRVAFAKLILAGANLLILDEPTNYMDIESKEKIEEVLEDYQGSILFVSHDRYFTKRLANRVLHLENQTLRHYEGDYDYYLAKNEQGSVNGRVQLNINEINDTITRLECELAFLSGKLSEPLEEDKKDKLNQDFLRIARELNKWKELKRNF